MNRVRIFLPPAPRWHWQKVGITTRMPGCPPKPSRPEFSLSCPLRTIQRCPFEMEMIQKYPGEGKKLKKKLGLENGYLQTNQRLNKKTILTTFYYHLISVCKICHINLYFTILFSLSPTSLFILPGPNFIRTLYSLRIYFPFLSGLITKIKSPSKTNHNSPPLALLECLLRVWSRDGVEGSWRILTL